MRLRSARRAGLSLLEVLVSLAIFLMAITALTYLVNSSSNMADKARTRSVASQLARGKLNEMAAGFVPLEARGDSSFDDDDPDGPEEKPDLKYYRWSAEVSEGSATGLWNVTVTVTYRPDDPFPVKVSLSRMIFDPSFSGSTQDVPAPPDDSGNDTGSSGSSGSSGGSSTPSSGGSSTPSSGGMGGGSGTMSGGGGKSGGSKGN